ncbi:hypothetical protein ACJJIW_13155 [Microbulbifer sp. JMSA004]|uniref:TolB family protein n=1 Tax=unclassified Microbulbifer TaxID=2619833 RepID=UPI00403A9E2A
MKALLKSNVVIVTCALLWCACVYAEEDIAYLAPGKQGYWQVWVMDTQGQQHRQLTHSAFDKNSLSWFPDGKRLLVNGSQGELHEVELANAKELPITMPLKGFIDASLAPDGKSVVFSLSTSDSVDDNNLWRLPLDGSDQQKLTNMRHMQHEPRWHPDGKTVYFLSGDGGEAHDIWALDLISGSKRQLTFNSLYNFDVVADTKGRLVFSSNRAGNYDLWLRESNGKLKQLTTDAALDAAPSWSPKGDAVVFQSTRDGAYNLWRLTLDDGELTQLTQFTSGARKPLWRPQPAQGKSVL